MNVVDDRFSGRVIHRKKSLKRPKGNILNAWGTKKCLIFHHPHLRLTSTPGYKYLNSVGCCDHHDLENENVWTAKWKASRAVSL